MADMGIGEAALLGAALGGGSSALSGQDPLKGALLGGALGGLGGYFGGGAGVAGGVSGSAALALIVSRSAHVARRNQRVAQPGSALQRSIHLMIAG